MLMYQLSFRQLITQFSLMKIWSAEGGGREVGMHQIVEIAGIWNNIEHKCHTDSLELQAAFFCLKDVCKNKARLHVMLRLENTTAVPYVYKKRGLFQSNIINYLQIF